MEKGEGDKSKLKALEDFVIKQLNKNSSSKKSNVANKLYDRLDSNVAGKNELRKLLNKPKKNKRTIVIKGLRNGSVSRFIKYLALDCVKEIIKKTNSEQNPRPIPKDTIEESRKKVEKLKDDFNKKIEEVYQPLLDALVKANATNLEQKKEKVNEIIEEAKKKIESLVEYYKGTSKTFDDQLKSERDIINESIKTFTDKVVESNCVSVRKSKTAFQKCVEPIYCEFTKNVTKAIDKVEKLTDVLKVLSNETINYVGKEIEKILRDAKEDVKKNIDKLGLGDVAGNADYLKNQSEDALKNVNEILSKTFNTQNNLNEQRNNVGNISADVNATQVLLREAINKYYNNPVPGNTQVDSYVNEKTDVIKQRSNSIVDEINKRNQQLEDIKDKIKSAVEGYTADKVNAKCKNVNLKDFAECVDNQFNELNKLLKPLVKEIENVNKNPIENIVNDLKEKTNTLLKEAIEKAKNEAQEIKEEAERKEKYVKDTKTNSDIKINTEVDPLINKTTIIVNQLSTNYDNVAEILAQNLTSIIHQNSDDPNGPLTDENKQYIKENVEEINNLINIYKEQLKIEESKAKDLESDLKTKANSVKEETLKNQCKPEWDVTENFKTCINQNIAPVNEKTDEVVNKVTDIIEKLKENEISTDLLINKKIAEIIKKTDETFTMNRLANDQNNSTTSGERITECLSSINKKINDEISPLIASLFAVPTDLKDGANKEVAEATAVINKAFKSWVESLDLAALFNPKLPSNNQQKSNIAVLLRDTLARINSSVQINLDSFTEFESDVKQIQDSLTKALSDYNAASLNKSCESVYSSRKSYFKCIDEECGKFIQYLTETTTKLEDKSNDASFLFLETQYNITKTIEEEKKRASDQTKEEAAKLFNANNVTKETVAQLALGDIDRFNVTPYINYVNDINSKAIELGKRSEYINFTGHNMLTQASLMLNLHVYAAYEMCPKVRIKNETDYVLWLIEQSRAHITPVFPNTTAYINGQQELALRLNNTLKSKIASLSANNIDKRCGAVQEDLYEYYACCKTAVKEFEDYFVPANKDVKVLSAKALEGLENNTLLLNRWRDVDVTNELEKFKQALGPIPEAIYTGPCNATTDKVLNFAMVTVNNRWNRFNKSIPEAGSKVVAVSKEILSKNYTGLVDVETKLNSSVNFLRVAIAAAQKKNASYVTPELLGEPQRNIGIGVGRFNEFISNISVNASVAINESTTLRIQSHNLYNNINKSVFEKACYNPNIPLPITQFVVCNNGFAYNFEVELIKLQSKLEETKKRLDNINDTSGKKVLEEYANKLSQDLLLYSAQSAINIYNANGLPIPDDLKPYVKSNCAANINAGRNPGCVITF